MTFRNENEYLIHLLYCAIHNTVPQDVPENISLEKVFFIGRVHEVANIAYLAIKKTDNLIPDDILTAWRECYYNAVKRDNAQNKIRTEALNALHSHGIYTLEAQGTVVKRYYPQSHLRMMSDIDIIVPKEKIGELEPIMQSVGYETESTYNGTEIHATKNNLLIELHNEFFYDEANRDVYEAINHPFSLATLHDDYTATVNDTVFYLFHLLHTIKHCECMGCGIRRIIDLYYLENELKDKVDYDYINGVLKENGFYEIKEKLLSVMNYWFNGIKPHIDISSLEKDIFEAGTHGTEELFFKHQFVNNRSSGKHFVKFRFFLAFIFPPKEDIYGAYPFCKEHNYPIALCWIHRWIFSVFNKKKYKSVKRLFKRLKIKMK